MRDFLFPGEYVDRELDYMDKYGVRPRTKKAFSDFVEEAAAESEIESPEYLRSEPTALMSTPQLATLHGKRVESHIVLTKDGYLLTLHRLISSCYKNYTSGDCIQETVLLHHGFLGSSADWILSGPDNSLPYILSNVGYDVWMTNARGNYYSRGHISRKVEDFDFWKFSWHEMGVYDLPAVVDYINSVKNSTQPMNYIGHSMGATTFLVFLSTLPEYNRYIKMAIFLAPLAYLTNVDGPLRMLKCMGNYPPEQLIKLIGQGEFMANRKVPHWIATKFCKGALMYCENPFLFFSGGLPEGDIWDTDFIARLLYHVPAGGSTRTILHYAQLIKSGKFHKFGDEEHEYPLNKVTVPIALISSSDDWLSTGPDVLRLFFSIPRAIDHYIIRDKKLHHGDFVWGTDASVVYDKVLDFLSHGLDQFKTNEV
ncbi:lipase 3-like [Colias croceus]|uniref:lipase 3-like n=1 Tax=Colias crocea TaxID=72248 RepID=UPI001E280B4D|nr:lipase 3-like [Colias croceus]